MRRPADPLPDNAGQRRSRSARRRDVPPGIYYHFVVRGDHDFTFVWHNTTGDLRKGGTIDHGPPNCWDDMFPNEGVSANVRNAIASLPETDIESVRS